MAIADLQKYDYFKDNDHKTYTGFLILKSTIHLKPLTC